jgi:F-type H+-transporting ATPase subunit epsilon
MALSLKIVTPEGPRLQESVDEVTAPSVSGEFGILPGHLPILAALKTGIVRWKSKGSEGACAIGEGFIEVHDDVASILTDRFQDTNDLDPVKIRAQLKDIDDKIDHFAGAHDSPEFRSLVADELWCAAQLELHGDPPPPTVNFVSSFGVAPDEELGELNGTPTHAEEEDELLARSLGKQTKAVHSSEWAAFVVCDAGRPSVVVPFVLCTSRLVLALAQPPSSSLEWWCRSPSWPVRAAAGDRAAPLQLATNALPRIRRRRRTPVPSCPRGRATRTPTVGSIWTPATAAARPRWRSCPPPR